MKVEVFTTSEEIQKLRSHWERLQNHPNSDLDHFLLVCNLRTNVIRPLVFAASDGDQVTAIVAARMERSAFQSWLGYVRIVHIPATILTIINGGFLGNWDERTISCFLNGIDDLFKQKKIDGAVINQVKEDSCLFSSALIANRRVLGIRSPRWSTHWEGTLSNQPGFLLKTMKSKHRAWINKKEKDLSAAFPNRIRWSWHSKIKNLEELCESMERVAMTTYQRGLNAGFVNDPATRQRLSLFAIRDQLRVFLLEIDGVPKAFWLGIVYGGIFHSSATGYVPEMREFEAGSLVFLRMVDELIKEGITKIDFGLGDAFYKQRFGTHNWKEAALTFFAPSAKARFAYALLTSAQATEKYARMAINRMGIVNKVKRLWRDHLRN